MQYIAGAFDRDNKLSNLYDDLRAAVIGDDNVYRKARKRLHETLSASYVVSGKRAWSQNYAPR